MKTLKKIIFTLTLIFFSTNLIAAQSQIAQVNGMMCIKCQKLVTKAIQEASPNATVKVSWPEGVAVSSFGDKSNLSELIVTDSIPTKKSSKKIKVLSSAKLFAEVMKNVHNNKSINPFFIKLKWHFSSTLISITRINHTSITSM